MLSSCVVLIKHATLATKIFSTSIFLFFKTDEVNHTRTYWLNFFANILMNTFFLGQRDCVGVSIFVFGRDTSYLFHFFCFSSSLSYIMFILLSMYVQTYLYQ